MPKAPKVEEERPELFRGQLAECLEHLTGILASKIPRGHPGAAKVRRPISDFCGVAPETVTRWMRNNGKLPYGEELVKLMCFLDMIGYRVIELQRMRPKTIRDFLELVGYGLLSMEEAARLVGYLRASKLSQVFRGRVNVTKSKAQMMWDLWKGKKDELERIKTIAREKYRLDTSLETSQTLVEAKPAGLKSTLSSPSHTSGHGAIVKIMEGLLVLLEERVPPGGFFNGNPNLAGFKESLDTILRLSAHLNNLGSGLVRSERGKKEGG